MPWRVCFTVVTMMMVMIQCSSVLVYRDLFISPLPPFRLQLLTMILFFVVRLLCLVLHTGKEQQDFYEQVPILLREMIYRLNDESAIVLKANHAAFGALTKAVPAEELVKHLEFMRNLMASMVSDSRRRKGGVGDGQFLLPGFNIPKGESLPGVGALLVFPLLSLPFGSLKSRVNVSFALPVE